MSFHTKFYYTLLSLLKTCKISNYGISEYNLIKMVYVLINNSGKIVDLYQYWS